MTLTEDETTRESEAAKKNVKPIRLAVIDTSKMACELLKCAVEASPYEIQVCTTATHDDEAAELVSRNAPDVVLISAAPNGNSLSGVELLRNIHKTNRSLRLVVLVDSADNNLVVEAFRCGAKGVCARNDSLEMLCKCIWCVHHGQIWASSQQLEFVFAELDRALPHSVVDTNGNSLLTAREEEIVHLVSNGLRNHDIAERLHLSEHTVKNHIFRVFDKLGISSRGELILYVLHQRR